jgi:hypothetical protein
MINRPPHLWFWGSGDNIDMEPVCDLDKVDIENRSFEIGKMFFLPLEK